MTDSMRAWQIDGTGEPGDILHLVEKPVPEPEAGTLVLKVKASAPSMPDVLQCRGTYSINVPRPMTPGLDFCGTVVAAGPGTTISVGTDVMGTAAFHLGFGAFADYCKASELAVFPLANGMSPSDACVFSVTYHTAWLGLVRRAGLKAGETLLVHGGAGGVGFAAIQLAKVLGARVLATAGGSAKVEACLAAGADVAFDHRVDDWLKGVLDVTNGRGVDIVYDPVGGDIFEQSFDCVAPEGRLVPIGFASGRRGNIPLGVLNRRNLSIIGAMGGGDWITRADVAQMHATLLDYYVQGRIRMNIDREIMFDAIPEGLAAVADRSVIGRIVAYHTGRSA